MDFHQTMDYHQTSGFEHHLDSSMSPEYDSSALNTNSLAQLKTSGAKVCQIEKTSSFPGFLTCPEVQRGLHPTEPHPGWRQEGLRFQAQPTPKVAG
jgi:hypothetical protein